MLNLPKEGKLWAILKVNFKLGLKEGWNTFWSFCSMFSYVKRKVTKKPQMVQSLKEKHRVMFENTLHSRAISGNEHAVLVIVDHFTGKRLSKTLAPDDGWTLSTLAKAIAHCNEVVCTHGGVDAYLGDYFVGSTEN